MILKELIERELERYLEWPTADRSHVTTVSAKLFAEHVARLYADHIADARKKVGRPQIREVFLRNGAVIPADRDDLPDWVYESVFELLDSVIQQAGPAIQYVGPAIQHAGPAVQGEPAIRKLGIMGAAFDPPSVRRAYTYSDQPNNTTAWKLGRAACKERSGGDFIDYGLQMLRYLQDEGFGVFEIDEAAPAPQPVEQQPAPDVSEMAGALELALETGRIGAGGGPGTFPQRPLTAKGAAMADYKLVPVEPTPEMLEAYCGAQPSNIAVYLSDAVEPYKAMLAAAPDVQGEPAARQPCPICFETEPHTGTCGSSDTKALCNREPQQPTPDVAGLVETLEGALNGRPLDTEFWDRCEQFIAAHRKEGGDAL